MDDHMCVCVCARVLLIVPLWAFGVGLTGNKEVPLMDPPRPCVPQKSRGTSAALGEHSQRSGPMAAWCRSAQTCDVHGRKEKNRVPFSIHDNPACINAWLISRRVIPFSGHPSILRLDLLVRDSIAPKNDSTPCWENEHQPPLFAFRENTVQKSFGSSTQVEKGTFRHMAWLLAAQATSRAA